MDVIQCGILLKVLLIELLCMNCIIMSHAEYEGIYIGELVKDRETWRNRGMGELKLGFKGVWATSRNFQSTGLSTIWSHTTTTIIDWSFMATP